MVMQKCICGHATNKHRPGEYPGFDTSCKVKGCKCCGWYWEGNIKSN